MESENSNLNNIERDVGCKTLNKYFLESAVFLIFFSISLYGTVFQTYMIQQTCINVFKFNITDCDKLGIEEIESNTSKIINFATQPYVANIFMAKSILENVLPAFVSLFIGPWSDQYGRKPVIIASLIGYLLSFSTTSLLTLLSQWYPINPWYFVVASVPIAFLGGTCCLITGTLCYVSDNSKKKGLALRMVVVDAAIFIGSMFGSLLSGYIFKYTSSLYIFILATISVFLSILNVQLLVKENIETNIQNKWESFRNLFDFSLVKSMISTCFEQRANCDRAIIFLTILSTVLTIFVNDGSSTVIYLFVLEKFSWTIKDYTIYTSIGIAIITLGNFFGIYVLKKIFKFSIIILALLGSASGVLDSVIKATCKYSWQMYLALAFGIFKAIGGPMRRSILSYVVPQNELGKIMSFTISLESLSTLAAAPLYTFVYSETIKVYPGVFHFISAGLYFLSYIFLSVIYGIQKSTSSIAYAPIT